MSKDEVLQTLDGYSPDAGPKAGTEAGGASS